MNDTKFEVGDLSPQESLHCFLYDESIVDLGQIESVISDLTPKNFIELIDEVVDEFCEDEPEFVNAISRFALYTDTEFIEPVTPEADFNNLTDKIEKSISTFIHENIQTRPFDLLNITDYKLIAEIYNPNNLLAFAKSFLSHENKLLTCSEFEMVLRYRTILKRLNAHNDFLNSQPTETPRDIKVGNKSWAGVVRDYCDQDGLIDIVDAIHFGEKGDKTTTGEITIDKVTFKLPLHVGRH